MEHVILKAWSQFLRLQLSVLIINAHFAVGWHISTTNRSLLTFSISQCAGTSPVSWFYVNFIVCFMFGYHIINNHYDLNIRVLVSYKWCIISVNLDMIPFLKFSGKETVKRKSPNNSEQSRAKRFVIAISIHFQYPRTL